MIPEEKRNKIINSIVEIKKGNNNFLNILYQELSPLIFYVAMRYLKDNDAATEVFQEFWAKIIKTIKSIRKPENGITYLRNTIKNMSINYGKKHKYDRDMLFNIDYVDFSKIGSANDPSGGEKIIFRSAISCALEKLTPQEKIVVQLFMYEDLTEASIAKRTNLSIATVKRLKASAFTKLKYELQEYDD